MGDIQFKAKVKTAYNVDDTIAFQFIPIPKITRNHCDMAKFRQSRKYGHYANSDLFPAMLGRIMGELGLREWVKLGELPDCVSIDTSGFLAVVSISVPME